MFHLTRNPYQTQKRPSVITFIPIKKNTAAPNKAETFVFLYVERECVWGGDL